MARNIGEAEISRPRLGFLIFGQAASLLGSQCTAFVFSVWILGRTDGVGTWSLILFCGYTGGALASFLTGPVLRRIGSRAPMLAACIGGSLASTALLVLHVSGVLEPWMLIVANTLAGAAVGVQDPAFIRLLFHIGGDDGASRLQGAAQSLNAFALAAAPGVGVVLYKTVGMDIVLCFDLLSFSILAISVLTTPRIPAGPAAAMHGRTGSRVGYRTLLQYRNYCRIVAVLALASFFLSMRQNLRAPIILGFTHGDTSVLAVVLTAGAVASVGGGLALSLRRRPLSESSALAGAVMVSGVAGQALFGWGRGPVLWVIGSVVVSAMAPVITSVGYTLSVTSLPETLRSHGVAFGRGCVALALPAAVGLAGPATRLFASDTASTGPQETALAAARVMVTSGLFAAAVGALAFLGARRSRRRATPTVDVPTETSVS
jgi:MFS family permease